MSVSCPNCKKEVEPYYLIKNKLFPIKKEGKKGHVRVELCGCPECKMSFIIEEQLKK